MDSFTEGILERARERQRKLLEYNTEEKHTPLREANENPPDTSSSLHENSPVDVSLKQSISEGNLNSKLVKQNSLTRISSEITGSPNKQSNVLNIQKDNFNMEIKLSSVDNVRVQVEFQESDEFGTEEKENYEMYLEKEDDGVGNIPALREDSKKRLQRLGALYAGGDDANISSPIHRTEATFAMDSPSACSKIKNITDSNRDLSKGNHKGLGGLATLAKTINQWEDNLSKAPKITDSNNSTSKKKSWKPPAPKPPVSCSSPIVKPSSKKAPAPKPPINTTSTSVKNLNDEPQQLSLDPALIKTLESQGFSRTISNSRLVFNYNNSDSTIKTAEICSSAKKPANSNCITEETVMEEEESEEVSISNIKLKATNFNKCDSPLKSNVKTTSIANRAAIFEKNGSPIKNNTAKDPALLSVSERKALFEKNKGSAPVPKAAISMAAPATNTKQTITNNLKPNSPMKQKKSCNVNKITSKDVSIVPKQTNSVTDSAYKVSAGQPGGIATKMAALFQNNSTISQQQIENDIREQRQKEMDILLNRFNQNKVLNEIEEDTESDSDGDHAAEGTVTIVREVFKNNITVPQPPPIPEKCGKKRRSSGKKNIKEPSPKVQAVLEDVKRIKVSSKPGRLYPCLSDIEATTEPETDLNTASPTPENSSMESNESDSEVVDTSFGRDILETVCKNQTPLKRSIYSMDSEGSDILDGSDHYLDEALAFNSDSIGGPTPPKQGRSLSPVNNGMVPSNSFQYKQFSPLKSSSKGELTPQQDFRTPLKNSPRISEDHTPIIVDGNNVLPLTHTVSFYRKQQTQQSQTPVRQIIRYPVVEENPEHEKILKKRKLDIKNKITELETEIEIQTQTIKQTSQALNWCYSTLEFTRSTEQVELERVLLLATHRRSAAQHEIERLNVLETYPMDNMNESSVEEGNLIISNIVLPLKEKYMKALNATGGKGHHVVCLVKCGQQVHATSLVSIIASSDENHLELSIPGTIILGNVPSNFTVQFEVYCLIAEEEVLPHEVKYHIKKKATPKKAKTDLRLARPPIESPGGPQVVRSSTFASVGFVVFDIQTMKHKNWTLNNAPSKSPLEGKTEMRVKYELTCTLEHRGFLNILDYLSDKAIWHRRWYVLKGHMLYSWKYPQDEKERDPIDSIDLKYAQTRQVGPAPRHISSRLYTIMIELMRPSKPNDKSNTLVMPDGDVTVVKYVFAADSQKERVEWNSNFNKILTAVKLSEASK